MFDFPHSLIILPFFFLLMLVIYRWEGGMVIWLGARVEYPYFNECLFKPSSQKSVHCYIESSTIFSNGRVKRQGLSRKSVVTPWQTSVSSVLLCLSLHYVSPLGIFWCSAGVSGNCSTGGPGWWSDQQVGHWSARCSFAEITRSVRPKPPSHAGSASTSRIICSPGGGCPVSAGINREWITFSRDSRTSSIWFSSQLVTLKR